MAENINVNSENVYVRKDVFDARMDRMEMLLEKTVTEMKAENAQFRSDIKAENAQFRNEIKAEMQELSTKFNKDMQEIRTEIRYVGNELKVLATRVDSLENIFYWGLGGFGIILSSAVIFPAIIGFLKKIFAPSLTAEDVKNIVSAEISRYLSGNAEVRQ